MTEWFEYPICVPYASPHYDSQYGGSHDTDVRTPPNTPITALWPGKITDISSPLWGKQVCLQVQGLPAPFMAYLHMSATRPDLVPGSMISKGELIGWSGGCTDEKQYAGTSNPTGKNFLNGASQSSQPQTGIAFMNGPVYGTGAGWKQFPIPLPNPLPHDIAVLNPTPLITQAIQELKNNQFQAVALQIMWSAVLGAVRSPTGIYNSWVQLARAGTFYGPAITQEITGGTTWNGTPCVRQFFMSGWCEWIDSFPHWYKYV